VAAPEAAEIGGENYSKGENGMSIPNQFFFFWGLNTALPYVRYLTMAMVRHKHPDADMYLYSCRCSDKDKWGSGIFCDFQFNGDELNKVYLKLESECVKIPDNLRTVAYDVLLNSKEPAPWDSIKYDQAAIETALRTCATPETLAVALKAVVDRRTAREAKRPSKHNYIQEAVERLGVKLCEYEPADKRVYTMPPPNVSDIFSVEILSKLGGWYLDLDQLVMKSLEPMGSAYDFIAGGQSCFYIGIFGSSPNGAVVGDFYGKMLGSYDEKYYNSSGITAIVMSCLNDNNWLRWFKDRSNGVNHIVEQDHFYPLIAHDGAKRFWAGDFNIDDCGSECVHYYGNNPVSQKAFREISPQNILTWEGGRNCMSRYISKISSGGQSLKNILCLE
jgi:hypothetical protein